MQNLIFLAFLCIFCLSCGEKSVKQHNTITTIETEVERIRRDLAPDKRTDRIVVEMSSSSPDCDFWTAYTTLPGAVPRIDSLFDTLDDDYCSAFKGTRLLPDPADGLPPYGLVRVSVANIRTQPGHSQELTSQALMGTPVRILDKDEQWYLIRTPDRYIAWLEEGALSPVSGEELTEWYGTGLYRYLAPVGYALLRPGDDNIVREVVAGNLFRTTGRQEGELSEILFPDEVSGWLPTGELEEFRDWSAPRSLSAQRLLETAQSLRGRPYLWGGTSNKGMDCSGFTKMAYYLNGFVIPRDASQQVLAGTEVPLDDDFSQLLPGDLLFFGSYRDDGSERVTHVGFYLKNGRFLHAGADNGYITENSFRPEDGDYAEQRLKSLLRARRLGFGTEGVVEVADAFFY